MTVLAHRVQAVLRVHPGEGRTLALAVAVAFLADAAIMIAQSSIDALFFARYGVEKLPTLYVLVGIAMFLTTVGVGALLARVGRGRAFVLIPAAISVAALFARAAVEAEATWVYGALWILQSVAEFTCLLAIWGLAGLVSDTRQAKRFFPLIAAGGVVGLIVGGLATGPLAATIGSENLLLVWAALMGAAAAVAWRLVSSRPPTEEPRTRRRRPGVLAGVSDVRASPLLRWMSAGALLTALLFSLLYLPFSKAAAERYPDADELAAFFGVFFALSMGTALVLSLLVTSRLLGRFGVPTVVLVMPVLYLVAFGVLMFAATFATLAAFRFAQIAWRSGGAGSTWEALVNTIPAHRRDRVRAFLTGVPTQLGIIVAGAVALISQRFDEPRVLYGAGLVGSALAVASISRVRNAYPRALVAALREGRPTIFGTPGGPGAAILNADVVGLAVLRDLLTDHEVTARLLAAKALADLDLPEAAEALASAAEEDDQAEVRLAALTSLERVDAGRAAEVAVARLSDPDSSVRLAALGVMARAGVDPPRQVLDAEELSVRALAAAILFEREAGARSVLEVVVHSVDPSVREVGYRAIATAGAEATQHLALAGLDDPDSRVRHEAAHAVAANPNEEAVKPLVALLADSDAVVRATAAEALGEVGEPAVEAVVDALFAEGHEDAALAALERLPLDGSATRLRRFASESVARALEDADLRSRLGASKDAAVELLHDSLRAREERHALAALHAAALLGARRSSVFAAIDNLVVSDPAQRATALEVIETVGDPAIVRPLLALWEPRVSDGFDALLIDRLRHDPDTWIRQCAEFAKGALEGGTMTHTLTTQVPLVERVIFLRKVPLFEALPPQELEPIAAVAEEEVFSEGELLAVRGEPGDTLYVIVDGQVQVLGADEQELAVRGPGDFIGEMAVISSKPRAASLVAMSDVRVLELHKPAFEAILRERPETALAMMRILCDLLASYAGPTE
jgi:HEAT repeat protein/predicted MFS family arabinose efflux permease